LAEFDPDNSLLQKDASVDSVDACEPQPAHRMNAQSLPEEIDEEPKIVARTPRRANIMLEDVRSDRVNNFFDEPSSLSQHEVSKSVLNS